jgi:serralysin
MSTITQICIELDLTSAQRRQGLRAAALESARNLPKFFAQPAHAEILDRFLDGGDKALAPAHLPIIEELAMTTSKIWSSARVLNIGFLDGSATQRAKVQVQANGWLTYANISFNFTDTAPYDIRISFAAGPGSWSAVGTDCFTLNDQTKPTMNLGWLTDDAGDDEYRRVTLHEFGHVLGCIHEHETPAEGMKWDKLAVYASLSGPPNYWNHAAIDHNMFEKFDKNLTQFSKLDLQSIMMYPIPASWTTDGFTVGLNDHLSETDMSFVRQQYPGRPEAAPAPAPGVTPGGP